MKSWGFLFSLAAFSCVFSCNQKNGDSSVESLEKAKNEAPKQKQKGWKDFSVNGVPCGFLKDGDDEYAFLTVSCNDGNAKITERKHCNAYISYIKSDGKLEYNVLGEVNSHILDQIYNAEQWKVVNSKRMYQHQKSFGQQDPRTVVRSQGKVFFELDDTGLNSEQLALESTQKIVDACANKDLKGFETSQEQAPLEGDFGADVSCAESVFKDLSKQREKEWKVWFCETHRSEEFKNFGCTVHFNVSEQKVEYTGGELLSDKKAFSEEKAGTATRLSALEFFKSEKCKSQLSIVEKVSKK